MAISGPLWEIFRSGTNTSVVWKDQSSNPRFAIYNPKKDSNAVSSATLSDDLVLDKETGLVWTRNTNHFGQLNRLDLNTMRREIELGNRSGWRSWLALSIQASRILHCLPVSHT